MEKPTNKERYTDFELDNFCKEIHLEVEASVATDEDFPIREVKFTEYIIEMLEEAGETEGARTLKPPYAKEDEHEHDRLTIKVNGYAIRDDYETLDLFIAVYYNTNEVVRILRPDFDHTIKIIKEFANAALKGHLENDIEPSSETSGLVKVIRKSQKIFDRINFFILSNGNIPFDPPTKTTIKSFEDLTCLFHVWDLERLFRLHQSKSKREAIEIDFKETFKTQIPCLKMPVQNDSYECYLAIVQGSILANLYKNYSTRLLESNVRAFLQQTGKINQGIRDTIRQEPEMFLPYNNGLSATAQEVKTELDEKTGQLVITWAKDFQIVNGGQTTASLFHTEKKYKIDLSNVFVQMKLTVIRDEDKKIEVVPLISRYANSQNKVTELDLTSNNPYLQKLEEFSQTTYAIDPNDRRKQSLWFFERVKGQYKELLNKEPTKSKKDAFMLKYPKDQIIAKANVSRYLMTWEQEPMIVSKGDQRHYTEFLKRQKEHKFRCIPKNILNSRMHYEDIVSNAILYKTMNDLFGTKNKAPIGDTNTRVYAVTYALAYLHFLTNNRLNLSKIWQMQTIDLEFKIELKKLLQFIYDHLANSGVGMISEYARGNKDCWTSLQAKTNHPMDISIVNKFLYTDDEYNSRYSTKEDNSEEIIKYDKIQQITSLGIRFWDGLCLWIIRNDMFSSMIQDRIRNIRQKIERGMALTDKEIEYGIEVIERLTLDEVDIEEIRGISKREDKESINNSELFNRISLIKADVWKQIIALGRQKGIIDNRKINVIEVVVRKLKTKEPIDLKQMKVVEDVLNIVKKFGIKV